MCFGVDPKHIEEEMVYQTFNRHITYAVTLVDSLCNGFCIVVVISIVIKVLSLVSWPYGRPIR